MTRRRTPDQIAERFGALVRDIRTRRGWTLDQLARRAGMNARYLGCVERGENSPTLAIVLELAAVLGVDPGTLVNNVAKEM